MRGVHDVDGNAPFYNALPRKFFKMPFTKADYVNATQGNQFINDLMPKYPIYLNLLSKSARDVVGQANAASEPAKLMLERQGFKYQGYIDIFDGGPTLSAERTQIDVVKNSLVYRVTSIEDLPEETPKYMAMNDSFDQYRCSFGRVQFNGEDEISITPRLAGRIGVSIGDSLRCYPV